MMKNRAIKHNKSSKINLKKARGMRGQSLLEYVSIIVAVVGALSVMSLYVNRSIQANLKLIENEISPAPYEGG
jgi:hypothetical protein